MQDVGLPPSGADEQLGDAATAAGARSRLVNVVASIRSFLPSFKAQTPSPAGGKKAVKVRRRPPCHCFDPKGLSLTMATSQQHVGQLLTLCVLSYIGSGTWWPGQSRCIDEANTFRPSIGLSKHLTVHNAQRPLPTNFECCTHSKRTTHLVILHG